jgi:hypothetical protein
MGQVAGDPSLLNTLLSHLGEYLDDELAGETKTKMDAWLAENDNKELLQKFTLKRGHLQLKLQELFLAEPTLIELRSYVLDKSIQATQEVVQIEQFGRREKSIQFLRKIGFTLLGIGLVGWGAWKFTPRTTQPFRPLEYLGFEALMLEESKEERLNLPTNEISDIKDFFKNNPDLNYTHKVLSVPEVWEPDGASVIDYEVEKVGIVQYHHKETQEKLFHFSFPGELSDLPKAETGNMRGLLFQTYSSDSLNLIAWKSSPNVVSILAGRRAAPELAEIAVLGSAQ